MNNIKSQQSTIEKIIENYNEQIKNKSIQIEKLNDELNSISTANNNNTTINDIDKAFSFPHKWATTCKNMANSIYLEPILQYYRAIFNSFEYFIEKPDNYEENEKIKSAYDFFVYQFERIGGLKRLIVNITYEALIYGFTFFTPKLEVVYGKRFGFKGKLDGIRGIKFYNPKSILQFNFDDIDKDELKSISILNSNINDNRVIDIDLDLAIAGYTTYGRSSDNILGQPFLYSAYSIWKVLESMDNSFNKNLNNIGEHSFNFIALSELNDSKRKEVEREIRNFISQGGGVFISKYGKLEKIESIDANEWYNFRDSMLSTIFKNKGVDIKALGLNKGATKNLADVTQANSILIASDIVSDIINSINNTFIKRYFDLNFKHLRLTDDCDYFRISYNIENTSL